MKHMIISLLLLGGVVALSATEASAVVCARGVHRAGCVTAGGAAVVSRGAGSMSIAGSIADTTKRHTRPLGVQKRPAVMRG